MSDKKTVVLTGGGTAGHINPALALAEELSLRGYNVVFAGTPGGIEARLVPAAGVEFVAFEASGFNRKHPLTLVKGICTIFKSSRRARRWLKSVSPAAVVGFGGYVSLPVCQAAETLGIPVAVHEQNSVPGMANKELAHRADAICVTYAQTADALAAHAKPGARVEVTGNPVRRAVYANFPQVGDAGEGGEGGACVAPPPARRAGAEEPGCNKGMAAGEGGDARFAPIDVHSGGGGACLGDLGLEADLRGNSAADVSGRAGAEPSPSPSPAKLAARERLGIPKDATVLLVFGGSLGARHINSAVAALKDELLARPELFVYQVSGPKEFDAVAGELSLLASEAARWRLVAYENDMPSVLAAADCAISRAGATSLAELAVAHLPALLVPYPHATQDHQTTNARAYVAAGAADMMPDADLDTPEFANKVFALVDDPDCRAAMRAAAAAQNVENAASALADVVEAIAK